MVQSSKMVAFEGVEDILAFLAPMWVEILFMVFFSVGFALIPRTSLGKKSKRAEHEKSKQLHKQIAADSEAGNHMAVLKTWEAVKGLAPAPPETLKAVVEVLFEIQPNSIVSEVFEHFHTHRGAMNNPKHANPVFEVLARSGRMTMLEELLNDFKSKLHYRPSIQTFEVLIGGYSSAGDEQQVAAIVNEMSAHRMKLTARGHSLAIKGFLKNSMVEVALQHIQDMHKKGLTVPSFALAQLYRTACQNNRAAEIFEASLKIESMVIPQDAIVVLLEDCTKRDDLALALSVEKHARKGKHPLSQPAYDALLKICVHHADGHALKLFQNMQEDDSIRIGEGFCVGLIARCADSKFLRFAEAIVEYVRSNGAMSIACYSALMKVYAYAGMYDKACDLYDRIRAEGLEPDSMMYGCLMKFSVECGRTELSRELFEKSPQLDIQNYMSLIRAAGRDKDVNKAFVVLDKLKTSGVTVDIAAYNCVLDACVSAGDMQRARSLMVEMQQIATLDIITYNTLLKGYCSKGDVRGAKELFQEMHRAGLKPNDISYNCMINAAVTSGNFREAWNTIDMMEKAEVSVDHYTISIMMKSLKRVKESKDVGRALELLDRSGVDICSDEILLNTVLETCTRHRQLQRLDSILSKFTSANIRPSVHTYGSLIKACSTLKRLDKCHEFWYKMVDQCGMKPNEIVLGCMLDALVCNDKVEEAVDLLDTWKSKVTPNTVMYSTIIKGFANSRQSSRALDMWREMCELGVTFNNVVYNALIDSQARVGDMDAVSELVKSMEPNGCQPDPITYSTIVKGYCVKGDLDKAFDVFRSMQKNGMALDSIVYNTIMDGCTRHNRMDLVDLVLEDMTTYNIKPSNFTLGILMKMYGRRHQLDKAFKVLEELPQKHGLQVNSQVKTCLMCACLSNNDIDRALRVFEDIKESAGNNGDVKAYSSMLSGLVRLGYLKEAVTLVEEAYGLGHRRQRRLAAGQRLDSEALETLVQNLGKSRTMQSYAVSLLEQLRAANVPVSTKLFSTALNSKGN